MLSNSVSASVPLVGIGVNHGAVRAPVVVIAGHAGDRDDGLQPFHAQAGGTNGQRPVVGRANHGRRTSGPVRLNLVAGYVVGQPLTVEPVDHSLDCEVLLDATYRRTSRRTARSQRVGFREDEASREEIALVAGGRNRKVWRPGPVVGRRDGRDLIGSRYGRDDTLRRARTDRCWCSREWDTALCRPYRD